MIAHGIVGPYMSMSHENLTPSSKKIQDHPFISATSQNEKNTRFIQDRKAPNERKLNSYIEKPAFLPTLSLPPNTVLDTNQVYSLSNDADSSDRSSTHQIIQKENQFDSIYSHVLIQTHRHSNQGYVNDNEYPIYMNTQLPPTQPRSLVAAESNQTWHEDTV